MKISVGVFAYNEGENIEYVLGDIYAQTLLDQEGVFVDIHILANGCVDRTVELAERAIENFTGKKLTRFLVHNLPYKGKSRVWTRFVHEISDKDSDFIFFVDADIRIPEALVMQKMHAEILNNPVRMLINSRPVKDIVISADKLTFVERLIAGSAGSLTDYKKSVCGQLYLVRGSALRNIYMPVGLPVEDGFLRAMLLTDLLTKPEQMDRIDGKEGIFHVYESIRDIRGLLIHQTRIMIGSAVNEGIYRYIRSFPSEVEVRKEILRGSSMNDRWLDDLVSKQFPKWPYGYVSFSLLTKRIKAMKARGTISIKSGLVVVVGFFFDCIVYVNASIKMFRGRGAGYW